MIYVMLAEGFEEIEALAFVDILRRADIKVETVSVDNKDTVKGAHGIEVVADRKISEIDNDGTGIVLPGGIPGTFNLRDNENVIKLLKEYNASGKYIAAICAAPSVLGGIGILKSKNATCYPSFVKELIGANVSEESVVVDGNIITSRGAGTAHKFALKFVELVKGSNIAMNLKAGMLYE